MRRKGRDEDKKERERKCARERERKSETTMKTRSRPNYGKLLSKEMRLYKLRKRRNKFKI